jgi:hypothetical protein
VYGEVPPVTVEEKLNKVLTAPVVGPVILTVNAAGEITTSWNAVLVAPL